MQPPTSLLSRAPWALLALAVGAALVIAAYLQAGAIPFAAHDDFGVLIRSQGGSMSHSPTYPDTFRQTAAHVRMLQNAYLGVTGILLVAIGAFGLVGASRRAGG